jgi:hypothetical protein
MSATTDLFARMKAAVFAHADQLHAMDEVAFMTRCVEISEPFVTDPADTLGVLLGRAAEAGSLEAAAAMSVMGMTDEEVAAALVQLVQRYPDLAEAVKIGGITIVVEEWLEEEVAAGRMFITIGPKGEKLYSSIREAS